jgi:hypothetical protein
MTQYCAAHREDWELFALGSLDTAQLEEMAAHLESGCTDCARLYMEAEAVVSALGTLPLSVEPSPDVEERLAARLRASLAGDSFGRKADFDAGDAEPRRAWNFWNVIPWVAAVALLILAVGLGREYLIANQELLRDRMDLSGLRQKLQEFQGGKPQPTTPTAPPESTQEVADLHATIDQLRRSLDEANAQKASAERETARLQTDLTAATLRAAALEKSVKDSEERRVKSEVDASTIRLQLAKAQDDAHRLGLLSAENDQMVRLLESTSLHQLPLKPVNALAGEANARVVWDDDRGLMLLANNLPELPDKRVFQLWILRKGTPSIVSAGVVQVDSRGRGTVFVPPGADLNAMAGVVVTDEPAGGSVSSRGSQVLLGKP